MRSTSSRLPTESADAAGLITALLVRFPQIATLMARPNDGTIVLSFAVAKRLDQATQCGVRDLILEHVCAFAPFSGEQHETLDVTCEADEKMTFVRVTRDSRSISREEVLMLTGLLKERFGGALVVNSPAADADAFDDDPTAQDELVEYALEALRDPEQQKSLVGIREEQRVHVYFVTARKKAKARARS